MKICNKITSTEYALYAYDTLETFEFPIIKNDLFNDIIINQKAKDLEILSMSSVCNGVGFYFDTDNSKYVEIVHLSELNEGSFKMVSIMDFMKIIKKNRK